MSLSHPHSCQGHPQPPELLSGLVAGGRLARNASVVGGTGKGSCARRQLRVSVCRRLAQAIVLAALRPFSLVPCRRRGQDGAREEVRTLTLTSWLSGISVASDIRDRERLWGSWRL